MDCFSCVKSHQTIHCKIILLDEQELIHEIEDSSAGQELLDCVFRNLNLLETAYFGLRFLDGTGQTHWLDPAKNIAKQIKGQDTLTFYFGVKFYAADPCKLIEEITRYQFFLQVKQDILQERLLVPFELAAELGAYAVQSELGDYDPRRHNKGYISEFRFLPNQSAELETRIADLHKTLIGQLPSVSEVNYLEKVKWLEMYGVDLHPVLGEDNVEYFLGLTPSGIIVLRNKTTVGNYYWPRITKIYFKGRYFMLRVTDKNNDENTYGFETPSKSGCKHLWKCCVEHHAFFRLVQVTPTSPDIFALGSRFRYSGRTEKQAVRDAQMKVRTPPTFSRIPSRRYVRTNPEGIEKVEDFRSVQETKLVSVPQPAQNHAKVQHFERADSPRSIKSAPWSQPHSKGLYNHSKISPRSAHSAEFRFRSSSVDSQSSNDSRSCKKRKHRSNRRLTSDNESEISKSSSKSHRKHRRRRSRSHRRDSESEHSEYDRKSSRDHRQSATLVNSEYQWQQVQKKLYDSNAIQQATVISSRKPAQNADVENKKRKHRKHPTRTPSERKSWLSEELKKHLEFDLVDTAGMSHNQLKEIPYTVVQTSNVIPAAPLKAKHWQYPNTKSIIDSNTPPPPYTPLVDQNRRNFDPLLVQDSTAGLPRMFSNLEMGNSSAKHVNNTSHLENFLRFTHEHTDSGLGTEQDCYNSEKQNERHEDRGISSIEEFLRMSGVTSRFSNFDQIGLPQKSEPSVKMKLSEMSTEL